MVARPLGREGHQQYDIIEQLPSAPRLAKDSGSEGFGRGPDKMVVTRA